MRKLLPILFLALGAAGFLALKTSRPQPEPAPVEEKAWPVAVQAIEPRTLSPQLVLYGRVESPRYARLTAALEADVAEVAVLEGERVEAGALLVRLDDREVRLIRAQRRAELDQIRARIANEQRRYRADRTALEHERRLLELARRARERAGRLARERSGSQSGLDQARQAEERQILAVQARELAVAEHPGRLAELEAGLARARALLARAELDLGRTRVQAPYAGRVTAVEVAAGDRVRPGSPLVALYDPSSLRIRAQIPTRHLAVVRRHLAERGALSARARVDGEPVAARLERLAGEVAPGSGGTDGLLAVEAGAERLEVGRVVELLLDLPPVERAVALPYEALYGGRRVYLLDGERLRGARVERLGERREPGGTRVLVRGAELVAGARVVLTQLPNAVEGLRVRVAEQRLGEPAG